MATSEESRLDAVRIRREALYQAMVGLEDALSTPLGDAERWRLRVMMAVDHAANRIDEHIGAVESTEGFLEQVEREEPRLAGRIEDLRGEHRRLVDDVRALGGRLLETDPDQIAHNGAPLRNQALDLMGLIARHRQRGADLIYEAYHVDIGGHS